MPLFIGKDQKKKELINNLEETYLRLQKDFSVPAGTLLQILRSADVKIDKKGKHLKYLCFIQGDFPEVNRMKKLLTASDFGDFPSLNEAMLDIVDDMMKYDIPKLIKKLPQEQDQFKEENSQPLEE